MAIGFSPLEWSRFAALNQRLPDGSSLAAAVHSRYARWGLAGLSVALLIGIAIAVSDWKEASGDTAEDQPVQLMSAVEPEDPAPPANVASPAPASAAPIAASVSGLKILSQHWRRAGFGSNALFTLTLRNGNDYPVKDIAISCVFSRGDGSHLTDRNQILHDTVRTRGRKTFTAVHVGFVNVNAERAKCAPTGASRS
jgi:hypothetical protein